MKQLYSLIVSTLFLPSAFAQTFNGQAPLLFPPGAPTQTVGVTESIATVSGIGILGSCYRVESVSLDLEHTWTGDIAILLISPAGTVLELASQVGGSQDDFLGTVFTDAAGINIVDGFNPFTGPHRPEGRNQNIGAPYSNAPPLETFTFANSFVGENADGDWTLYLDDFVGLDSGELLGWSITFVRESNLTVDAGPDQVICQGETATLEVVDGLPSASYTWSDGQSGQAIDVSPATTTLYSVTVDDNGCIGEDEVEVAVTPSYEVSLVLESTSGDCAQTTVNLAIDLTNVPANSSVDYRITATDGQVFEEADQILGGGLFSAVATTITQTTTFTLESVVIDGCAAMITDGEITVTLGTPPDVQISGPTEFCPGETITLTASGADTYLWSTGDTGPSITFQQLGDITITVTGTTADGCSADASQV
ncbi:MAG: hypothetical protein D6772_05675, partial [Bacteroidetes bacterium]